MNEFDDGCSLTKVIKAREAAIANLKAKLEESEEQYVALQQANNEKWTEVQSLRKEVQELKDKATAAKEDKQYLAEENQLNARIRGLEEECVRANRCVREREAELFKVIASCNGKIEDSRDENRKLTEQMTKNKLDYEAKIHALLSALVAVVGK